MQAVRRAALCAVLLGCSGEAASHDRAAVAVTPAPFASDSLGFEIRDIAIGSRVWSVNRGGPSLAAYDLDGALRWHGVELGEGVDAVRTGWSVVASRDTAFVWDPLTKRLLRVVGGQVSPEVTFDFITTHSISGTAMGINFGHPGRLRRFGDGWITYATEGAQSHAFDLTQIVLLRFDSAGKVRDTLLDLRSSPVLTDHAAWRASGPKQLLPVPMWDVCGARTLVLFDPGTLTLRWNSLDGGHTGQTRFAFTPGVIPDSLKRAYLLWQLRIAAQGRIPEDTLAFWAEHGFDEDRWIYGDEEPFVVKMFCDGRDRVWLQRFSSLAAPRGLSRDWVVVDLATRTQAEVLLPDAFQPMAGDTSRLYGVIENDLGVQSVATIPIDAALPATTRR